MINSIILTLALIISATSFARTSYNEENFLADLKVFEEEYKRACAEDLGEEFAEAEDCEITISRISPMDTLSDYSELLPDEGLTYEVYSTPEYLTKKLNSSYFSNIGTLGPKTEKLAAKIKAIMIKAIKGADYSGQISASSNDAFIYDHFFFSFDDYEMKSFVTVTFGFSL